MTDYSKLSDFEINCRVAIVLGMKEHFFMNAEGDDCFDEDIPETERGPIWQTCKYRVGGYKPSNGNCFNPCNNPADAWPIIVSNGISIVRYDHGMWLASSDAYWVDGVEWQIDGEAHQNPLRAAMIAYLMMQDATHANS